jgi:NADH:ubiquinone oxidoreductase subunit 2 (subunit N)
MILGISLLYMETGSFNYTFIHLCANMDSESLVFQLGRVLILLTIILKLAGAPLHSWAPDLYDSQPASITQYLLVVPKLGNFLLLSNIFALLTIHSHSFDPVLIIGCISIVVGSLSLLSQVKIKRFFAFSSICHVGFLLLALYFGGYTAYLQYVVIYALTTINIFIIILLFPQRNNLNLISMNLGGLPLFIAFSINLFSLAGLPPLAGFYAKLGLLGTILNQPYIGVGLILLFILGSTISGYNYFRIISKQLQVDLLGTNYTLLVPSSLYDILAILTTILIIYPVL